MKFVLVAMGLLASSAQAHIEPGVYVGFDKDNVACEMEIGKTFFINGVHHPLNERIEVKYQNRDFLVRHPEVVNNTLNQVRFDHDTFQGVLAIETGAVSMTVFMEPHTEKERMPETFNFIESDWKTGLSKSLLCQDLKYQK